MKKGKTMKTRKTKVAIAISALAVTGVIGGTFAYWNQTSTIENPFDTGTYGTSVVENFKPTDGEEWEPGATIDKEVYVTNDGDYDLIVRVKLDETWADSDTNVVYKTNEAEDTDTAGVGNVYLVSQKLFNDGLTEEDNSVVEKTFSNSLNWVNGGDGWYYYTVNVAPGEATDNWLTNVTLDEDVDMGVYNTTTYLSTDDGKTWIEYTYAGEVPTCIGAGGALYYESKEGDSYFPVTNNKSVVTLDDTFTGYSNSDYTLTITVETVQATEEAVEDMFNIDVDNTSFTQTWTYVEDEN